MNTMLAVGQGLAQGAEKASANIFNIMLAKHKLQREEETFGLDKKIKELEIKKAEYLLSPEQLQAAQDKLKAETAAKTASFNLANITIAAKLKDEERKLETHKAGMTALDAFQKGHLQIAPGQYVKIGDISLGGRGTGTAKDESLLYGNKSSQGDASESASDFLNSLE